MYVVTRTVRRPDGLQGTVTRLEPVAGRYVFPSVEADTLAASLAARDRDVYPRPRYASRRNHLPACDGHDEHQPGCQGCADAVSAWLEEIREHASARTDPVAVTGKGVK